MCLDRKFNRKNTKTFIDNLDIRVDGYIWLWKCFAVSPRGVLKGQYYGGECFYDGKNTCIRKKTGVGYMSGFHCFARKTDAVSWNREESKDSVIVPVKVKKSWITTIGEQGYNRVNYEKYGKHQIVVCEHIII